MDGSIRKSFSFAVALVASFVSVAQWRNAHWQVTGDQIDFTSNGAEVSSSPVGNGPYASISDPEGNLLFYTSGVAVFNTNGDTIGDVSAPWGYGNPPFEQGWVFVPWPGDTQRVALFALVCFAGPVNCELHSYTLDRTLNDGAGGMVPGSDVLLMDSTTQQLTAVAHSNGEDYWAITHQRGTDAFSAFQLTASGVNAPVISHTGFVPPAISGLYGNQALGPIVVSANGAQLAALNSGQVFTNADSLLAELCQFNAGTGVITHSCTFPVQYNVELAGAEFSPDGSKLYLLHSTYDTAVTTLEQYDVSSADEGTVLASHQVIHTDTLSNEQTATLAGAHAMALAPDGRIYIEWGANHYLTAICSPDEPGAACNFQQESLALSFVSGGGLPNQCKRYHDSALAAGGPNARTWASLETRPNPTAGSLTVRSSAPGALRVLDLMGRSVLDARVAKDTDVVLDLGPVPSGVYLLRLQSATGQPLTKRIVKN